jgi:K+-sensing histidine kinase KdpD
VLASASSVEGAALLLGEMSAQALQAERTEVDLLAAGGIVSIGPEQPSARVERIPLTVEGQPLGELSVHFDPARELDADDRGLMLALAEVGAQAIDRARLHDSERAARADAEAAFRAQEEFLSIAAHELRTPVSAIKATAQLAERAISRGPLEPERVTRHLQNIARASDRLAALIEDLLDVSRLQTGRLQIRRRLLDLRPLVQEVVDRYIGTVPNHHFDLQLPGEPVMLEADPLRLEQVLDNVLSNAVKYSPNGGAVDIRVWTEQECVTLMVTDQGIGVPAGQVERIFEVFGRASNAAANQIQGLGLGLAICRQLVGLHGGRMWATSAGEGHGLAVGISLPGPATPDERSEDSA